MDWSEVLIGQLLAAGLPAPRREYLFHADRKWRFDLDWKPHGKLVAVEIDGGSWGNPVVCDKCGRTVHRRLKNGREVIVREGGRHNSGTGFENDLEKINEAILYGWTIIRVTPTMIQDGRALDWIERALL